MFTYITASHSHRKDDNQLVLANVDVRVVCVCEFNKYVDGAAFAIYTVIIAHESNVWWRAI